GPQAAPKGALNVVVTVPPLGGLVKRLAPEASVTTLVKSSQSEHGTEFTPADIGALRSADVVVYVGLGLEPRVHRFLSDNPSAKRQGVGFAVAGGGRREGG